MKQGNDRKPVKINRLLAGVFDDRKWRSRIELHEVFEFWDEVVGRDIAAVAQPAVIRGRTLWIKVKDSVWMQHLHLQQILLLEKINDRYEHEKLKDIHFQLDSSLAAPPEPDTANPKPVLLDKKQEQGFDNLISSLENEALKTSLKRLWVAMKAKGR